ncbi:DsbE family thiol:disulfide interchange protein [Cohaesibacter celericrescens]|uniref:DsbE family thiol:disulfide interchange protein n=1 Tax=Cohaesibacter celericrescens TaxID=2067669 RepID=A0A2N5XPI2_9HYPH|nr:DsbE family thiol:disulfide interchange protein [Cohaesibacter celericrescens]PLW76338.1 DsbE family thiol:disulfide interchange protein [Cohaesibacter celericrescens]
MSETKKSSESSEPSSQNTDQSDTKKGGFNVFILLPLVIFMGLASLFLWQMANGADPNQIPSVLINKPAPQFDLPALDASFGIKRPDGGSMPGFKTADFIGKVSVVNVWASWCPTCRDEHPMLLNMTQDDRFELIGLAYKDEPANSARFLSNHGNPFDSVGMDISGRVGIDWGVYGAPETFIVDKTGTIRYKHIGALTPRSLAASFMPKLEEILAE